MKILLLGLALAARLSAQEASTRAASTTTFTTWIVPWDKTAAENAGLSCFSELNPFVYAFAHDHSVKAVYPELLAYAPKTPGQLVIPVIVNDVFDKNGGMKMLKSPELLSSILNDGAKIEKHVAEIMATLPIDWIDGVEIDYERIPPGAWGQFNVFMRRLAQELHARGKRLHVDVEAGPAENGKAKEYWGELARHADSIKLMAYYQRGAWTGETGPGSSLAWIERTARRALEAVPAEKLSIALSLAGTEWELPYPRVAARRKVERLHYDKVLDLLGKRAGKRLWSEEEKAPYFDYEWKGAKRRLWYEDERSLAAKLEALRGAGVRAVALWYLGKRHPDLNTAGLCRR
jgi:spore germination protein